jgi:hypothetical protein
MWIEYFRSKILKTKKFWAACNLSFFPSTERKILISKEIASHRRLEHLQNIDSERLRGKIFQNNDLASPGSWRLLALPVIWLLRESWILKKTVLFQYFDCGRLGMSELRPCLANEVFSHQSLQNIDFK